MGNYRHLSVLIVDDEHFVRRMEQRVCEALGVGAVCLAGDGYDAVAQAHLAEPPFDIIICDLNMPGLDGIETLRHLAACTPGCGIVVASAVLPPVLKAIGELVKARGLRLLGCVNKPITVSSLGAMLETYVLHRDEERRCPVTVTAADLRRGLSAGEILPFFQPKIDLATDELIGVEALARWSHPQHGVLTPATFLALADRTGQLDTISDTILAHSIREAGRWAKSGRAIDLAVNVEPLAMSRLDLPNLIFDLAAESGLPLDRLVVEITESDALGDRATMLEVVTRLSVHGVRLSIDDFGTGHSSMQRLIHLPFNELKLDRSFVVGALDDPRVRIVLESNLTMAKRLDLKVVAEGIETEAQADLITELGCDVAQGYLFARPMPSDLLWRWNAARCRP